MPNIKVQIDAQAIAAEFADVKTQIEGEIQAAVKILATATHAKITELAHSDLKANSYTQKEYLKALKVESISENIHVVSLDESAVYIEDGRPKFDMKPNLLKNGKTSKSGSMYKVIPFEQGKKSSEPTQENTEIIGQIKSALKSKKIPFRAIERHPIGSPKLGKLHTIDIQSDIPGKGNTPQLQGLTIFQSKNNRGNVQRNMFTFRTVSSGEKSKYKWFYPEVQGKDFFKQAEEWALSQWDNQILPEILSKFK